MLLWILLICIMFLAIWYYRQLKVTPELFQSQPSCFNVFNPYTNESFVGGFRPIHMLPYHRQFYSTHHPRPMTSLPPGYDELHLRDQADFPIIIDEERDRSTRDFCRRHPMCYPCYGWQFYGGTICP